MSLVLALVLAPAVEAFTSTADVRACRPLADGRVLAATSGGLVLYGPDLEPERVWTAFDSLPGTDVKAIAISGDGATLWAGGEDGVAVLRPGETRWQPLVEARSVGALLLDDEGRLLVGAAGGLDVVDARTGAHRGRFDLPRDRARLLVTSLVRTTGGVRLGTSGRGLWSWDGSALHPSAGELPSPYLHVLASAGPRTLAGTVGGLVEVGRGRVVSTAEVRALLRVEGGWLAGTMGEGLRRIDDAGTEHAVTSPSRFVTALGREGDAICAGTPEGTFVRRGPDGAWRHARVTGPPSNDVSALALDGERLWVGTFDRGLASYERGRWSVVSGVDERVNGLAVEGGRLWVATARGLVTVERGTVGVHREADGLPADDVHAVAALRGGGVVVGTARGAALVRAGGIESLVKTGAPAEATWAVAEAPDGSLWLGTTNGLYRYRAGAPVGRFSVASGHLRDPWVTSVAFEGPAVWVGTYAGGVSRLTLGARNVVLAEPGAADAHVNPAGLGVFGGRVWAATMSGLLSLRMGDTAWRVEGGAAPGRDVTAVVRDGRAVWVASRDGLARWSGAFRP